MGPTWTRSVLLSVMLLSMPGAVRADQLTVGGQSYAPVRVLQMREGFVTFRPLGGNDRTVWVGDIEFIAVDSVRQLADLNEAERYLADGDVERALVRYGRAQRLAEGFWGDLVQVRLLRAYDRAGPADQAALCFIKVMRGEFAGVSVAAGLFPRNLPVGKDATGAKALEHLRSAGAGANESQRLLLELLRYQILRAGGDDKAAALAREVAERRVPEPIRRAKVYEVQLTAVEQMLAGDFTPGQLAALDQVIADCPEEVLPSALLLKGETRLRRASTREELIRASWPFLRVAIHMPGDPRAADGLYGAARVLERMGRPRQAVQLLQECLAHPQVSATTRARAEADLVRLQAAP